MQYLDNKKLIEFRKLLHQHPELSGNESGTAERIKYFLNNIVPDEVIDNIGGYGFAYLFNSYKPGPTVLIRADIDALPITEINTINHISKTPGVSHLCGHDGHAVILCGLAQLVNRSRPVRGKLVLLFQPAEETGQGAIAVIRDSKFDRIKPDFSFALHNLPGYKKNAVCVRKGVFSSASVGMIIELKGKPSHAAYPENGINPDVCIAEIITEVNKIKYSKKYSDLVLATVIHIKLGEIAFGTSPGDAVIMLTIRSYNNDDMRMLLLNLNKDIDRICTKNFVEKQIRYTEDFPASINSDRAFDFVYNAALENKEDIINLNRPFRWSEDFGYFGKISDSTIFGVGSGENHPQLHNENYDFPDEILNTGISMFFTIYKNILLKL